ncbi:hypothetical protein OG211_13580 [Streptomyces niveus]|uniref:hypothetical protein n=1 Tax=Streptomyces niveus TaxID=193462 RepID=UPI00386C4C3B|nr:hypothetical protein OG211_13580 [Streptomyces niveus]
MTTVSRQSPALGPFDFAREVYELVRDTAPRLFAVVEEYRLGTEDADAFVVAWGLAYDDGAAEAVAVEGSRRWSLAAAENILRYFGRTEDLSARLVWLPALAPSADADTPAPSRAA